MLNFEALAAIVQSELVVTVKVADMVVDFGINGIGKEAAFIVHGITPSGAADEVHIKCTREAALAVLSLLTWGDEVPGSAMLYQLAEPVVRDLPLWLRPIP